MATEEKSKPHAALAAVLALLVPGAGHIYIGRVKRGLIIFLTITATFWAGIAMGGVMTCDVRYERWWFAAEMLTGVNGVVGWHRQNQVYRDLDRDIPSQPGPRGQRPSDPRMAVDSYLVDNEIALVYPVDIAARAYAGVAGLLNLLCVFDAATLALMGVTGEDPDDEPTPAEDGES